MAFPSAVTFFSAGLPSGNYGMEMGLAQNGEKVHWFQIRNLTFPLSVIQEGLFQTQNNSGFCFLHLL